MGEQPGAGRTHSFKIKGHSRQRRAAKPYSRPSDRKKGVLESVRDFFSPSWLLDFWKGKSVVEEDESEDFDDENSGEEPAGISQDFGPSRVLERAGPSTLERVTRQEVLGNGGPGFMASAQKRTRTPETSGLSALLAIRSREPLNKKALETKTTAFASSSGEYSRSNEYSSSYMQTVETQEGESLTQDTRKMTSDSGPSPILLSSQSKPGPSSFFGTRKATPESGPSPALSSSSQSKSSPLFGTSLIPGASSTPVSSQTTPGPSLLPTERLSSSSRPQPTSVFRSKPEFSLSAFGSVLPSRSTSQTQRYSSPYYSGKTIFGGASSQVSKASKRARVSSPGSTEISKPVKKQIRPTPIAGTSGGGVTSQTAKRILETLERMSSPLEDAKKIPPSPPFVASSSPLSFTSKRRKAPPQPYNKPIGSPRKLQAQFGGPPVQSLSVPRRAVISRLQPKTDASVSQMTSTPLSTGFTGKSSSRSTAKPIQSFVPTPLPMSLSPMESSKGKGGGKIKTAKTSSSHYKSQPVDEEEHEVTNPLPVIKSAIPLTIPSGSSMPSFSFPTSSTSIKTTPSKTDSAINSFNTKSPDVPPNKFKFSAPEPRNSTNKTASNLPDHQKINYSFSKPAPVINSENSTSNSAKSPVSDSLEKFKPAEGSWECSTCMVNNKPEVLACAACTTPKPTPKPMETTPKPMETTPKSMETTPKSTTQPSNDLFKQFQPASGSWTCNSCMLTNQQAHQKCIACETPRPSTVEKQKPDLLQSKNTLFKQFAPASDSWECPDCMLSNKAQDSKCVACQAQKPGQKSSKTTDNLLSKQFTPAEGSWTCDTCMIVNKADVVKCVACETPKPGSSAKPTSFTGGFKVSSDNKLQNSPFKFGSVENKDSSKGDVSSSNTNPFKMTSASTIPFVFGASTSTSSETSFTFGSTTTTSNKVQFGSTDSSNFKFGSSEESTQVKPTFQFGKGTESKSSEATITFKFGSASASTEKQPTFTFGSSAKTENAKIAPAFVFGGNSIDAKNPTVTKESPKKPATQEPLKAGSIAQAAAAGLLKIPSSSVDVVDLTSDASKPDLPQKTIEGAAPPNLFAGKSIASPAISLPKAIEAKPPATTSLAPLPFVFGAPSAAAKSEEGKQAAQPSFAFQPSITATTSIPKFGEPTTVTTTAPIQGFPVGLSLTSSVKTTAKDSGAQLSFAAPSQQGNVLTGFPNATKNTTTASPFVFKGTGDSNENKLSTPSTGFGSFGSFAPPSGNGGFSFGGTTKSVASSTGGASAPFVFGAGETQKQSGFSFGSTTQGAPQQTFVFGGSNPTPQLSAPPTVSEESMDADGNNNNNQPAALPSFGSTLAPATQPSAPFSFTSTPANTGFNFGGAQQPSTFKFGDTSSNPPIFGGSSTPAFGGNTGTPVQQGATSGFNFSSPATNNTGSQPRGFNFTGGSSSAFTAGAGTASKRVIKRGIRRTRK